MESDTVVGTMINLLQNEQVVFTLHEHAPSRTFADASALSFPLERLVKTIAFRLRAGGWLLVALRGQDRVDYRKLALAVDARRADLFSLSPEEVVETFGVEAGSVGPLMKYAQRNAQTQVLFDARIPASETIFCGVGRNDRTLEMGLADLVRLVDGKVVDLAREEG